MTAARSQLAELFSFDGANPFLLSQPGEYAVEAGPVPTVAFRRKAAQLLAEVLGGVTEEAANKALQKRVRVVQGISKRAAEGLVEAMGRRETAAKVVQGPPPKNSPWKGGTPVLGGVAAGVAGGFLAGPLIGVIAGGALLGGIAFANTRTSVPVLGAAPLRPDIPHSVADAPDRMLAIVDQLPPKAQAHLVTVGRVGFHIIGRLSDDDDLLGIAADGLDGELGQAAVAMVGEAVRVAELIAAAGAAADNSDRLTRLAKLAQTADEALEQLGALGDALAGERGQEAMQRETARLNATVAELKKMQ